MLRKIFLVSLLITIIILGAGCYGNPPPQYNSENPKPQIDKIKFNGFTLNDGLSIIYPKGWAMSENSTGNDFIFINILPGSNSSITLELLRQTPPSPLGPHSVTRT